MVGNNLLYTWHTECHCSFSSSQMASIKTYLTAVYHGQLHFRCKWGLLSIIHRHHYAWHTVWHLTQVVTAKRHQWLVTGLHVGCRHHHLCPSFIHTHNSRSTEFILKALFLLQPALNFKIYFCDFWEFCSLRAKADPINFRTMRYRRDIAGHLHKQKFSAAGFELKW